MIENPAVNITLDKNAKLDYVPPIGCDFIPTMLGNDTEIGTCVCAPEWGHNAATYERYVSSTPPKTNNPNTHSVVE